MTETEAWWFTKKAERRLKFGQRNQNKVMEKLPIEQDIFIKPNEKPNSSQAKV